ncbi:MAG: 2-C-methyl-D-erythritol 4-phosphate cytidylyltransferase [Pirellulaceae bacterium]|nr:MAG: 2-C-methyl-D-erythritol 4-phosphate cytidylyltransferase [Pirellulaceae bacterium]
MSKFAVILPAAGQSRRFNHPLAKKVFVSIRGKPLWLYAAEAFCQRADVVQVLLVIAEADKDLFNERFAANAAMWGIQPVIGGPTRAASVRNALEHVTSAAEFVAVHDAARPCLAPAWIDAVFARAVETGAAILAEPCPATLKRVDSAGHIEATVSRDGVWLAQTPQVFRCDWLKDAYARASNSMEATDEASLVEAHHRVAVVEGSSLNIKVTRPEDLKLAELALQALPKSVGFPFQ